MRKGGQGQSRLSAGSWRSRFLASPMVAGRLFVFSFLLVACGGGEVRRLPQGVSLELGPGAVCEDLDLATQVARPNSHSATRFLNGWWPDHDQKGWLRAPTGSASIALATDGRGGSLVLATEAPVLRAKIDGQAAAVEAQDSRQRIEIPYGPPGIRYLEIGGEEPFSVQGGRFLPLQDSPMRVTECSLALDSEMSSVVEIQAEPGVPWSLWDSSSQEPLSSSKDGAAQSLVLKGGSWSRLRLRHPEGARLRLSLQRRESTDLALVKSGEREKVTDQDDPVTPEASEAQGVPGTPDGVGLERPRLVLVYVMDALRAEAVDNLAPESTWGTLGSQGLSFGSHRAVAPNTLPSTKALHVGRVWNQQGGWSLGEEETTLAERFRDAGYRTGLFSNNPWVNTKYGLGQGFEVAAEASPEQEGDRYFDDAERLHEAALSWVSTLAPEDSVFLYVHVLHPHNPYRPPPPLVGKNCSGIPSTMDGTTETLAEIRRGRIRPQASDRARIVCLYRASLEYADAQLGEFLKGLGNRFEDHETLVVATSDHGEELFEHRGVLHGYTLFEEMIRIPLVVWAPGRIGVGRISRPTSTLDVHGFLAEVAESAKTPGAVTPGGLPAGRLEWLSKRLLAADGPAQHFAAAASVKGGIFSLQRGRWKVIWAPRRGNAWGQGQGTGRRRDSVEVYDLEEDPMEMLPLPVGNQEEALWLLSQLRGRIRDAAAQAATAGEEAKEPEIDEALRRRLKSLGYAE
ncbi:MAG: sulfatase-like hydrolase/transferase [Deltaproteobacteria bacterium]|nr:sulfatase-like hydrolase/transferase [Deltaproteobacteria bacterium]